MMLETSQIIYHSTQAAIVGTNDHGKKAIVLAASRKAYKRRGSSAPCTVKNDP